MNAPRCESCGAPLRWARTRSGKWMPLDAAPNAEGNVMLAPDGTAMVVGKTQEGAARWMPHHATCEHAGRHRKGRRAS
jgi:hypothetical protein